MSIFDGVSQNSVQNSTATELTTHEGATAPTSAIADCSGGATRSCSRQFHRLQQHAQRCNYTRTTWSRPNFT